MRGILGAAAPRLVPAVAVVLALAACTPSTDADVAAAPGAADVGSPDAVGPSSSPAPAPAAPSTTPSPTSPPPSRSPASPSPSPSPSAVEVSDAELAALGVNELGRVPIVEWHVIGDQDGAYRTSRSTLRAQLQELYDRGYRPVTQAEFITGTFPIPAGTSPVVLTFDDSTRGQCKLGDDGEPLPDTAVGILEAFAAEHSDWRATAVFGFNFPQPFGDAGFADELEWLAAHGYEFSNHSLGHANLGALSSAEVVANLAENQARLQDVLPDAQVPSLTLPFGVHAEDRAVERSGSANGTTYRHDLVYLVGAYPSRSPHDVEFDPGAVQRVPAHAVTGTGPEWFGDRLDDLDEPGVRFVADGDASTVTVPSELAGSVELADPTLTLREY